MFYSDTDFFFLIPEHLRNEEYCDCYEVVIIFFQMESIFSWQVHSIFQRITFFFFLKVLSYSRENINYVW